MIFILLSEFIKRGLYDKWNFYFIVLTKFIWPNFARTHVIFYYSLLGYGILDT